MTALEITRRAIALLAATQGEQNWYEMEAEISALIPIALQRFAEQIADDPGRHGLTMQDYSVTLTSGIGVLTTATGARTALADILWQSVSKGVVKDADGVRLHYVSDLFTFQGPQVGGYNYYTITDNGRLYARTGNEPYALGNISEPLTVTANFIPTVATVPGQLEDDAVEMLVKVTVQKLVSKP
jgi:hypothetical protein